MLCRLGIISWEEVLRKQCCFWWGKNPVWVESPGELRAFSESNQFAKVADLHEEQSPEVGIKRKLVLFDGRFMYTWFRSFVHRLCFDQTSRGQWHWKQCTASWREQSFEGKIPRVDLAWNNGQQIRSREKRQETEKAWRRKGLGEVTPDKKPLLRMGKRCREKNLMVGSCFLFCVIFGTISKQPLSAWASIVEWKVKRGYWSSRQTYSKCWFLVKTLESTVYRQRTRREHQTNNGASSYQHNTLKITITAQEADPI